MGDYFPDDRARQVTILHSIYEHWRTGGGDCYVLLAFGAHAALMTLIILPRRKM
jgi:hypothetical protein